jgi:hypothetical protein
MRINMSCRPALTIALGIVLLGGCARTAVHVAGPFYLDKPFKGPDVYLLRCPEGPRDGCGGAGLPGPSIVKAGGNRTYVVVAQADIPDSGVLHYFYFARVPEERESPGLGHEKVVGPLTKAEFDRARESLGLPAANIRMKDTLPTVFKIAFLSLIAAAVIGTTLLAKLLNRT